VVVPDLAAAAARWPGFAAATLAAGFTAVHAMPMRRRAEVIGALTLFRTEPGELAKVDARVAQAMADIATIGISQARAVRHQEELAGQLQHALNSRVVIEQAKGVLAERLGLGMAAAFDALRTYARSHNTRVSELALSVVAGQFDTSQLRP
jgi:GAF domain-containing protein